MEVFPCSSDKWLRLLVTTCDYWQRHRHCGVGVIQFMLAVRIWDQVRCGGRTIYTVQLSAVSTAGAKNAKWSLHVKVKWLARCTHQWYPGINPGLKKMGSLGPNPKGPAQWGPNCPNCRAESKGNARILPAQPTTLQHCWPPVSSVCEPSIAATYPWLHTNPNILR